MTRKKPNSRGQLIAQESYFTNHQPQSSQSPDPFLVGPASVYSSASDPEPIQTQGSGRVEATQAEHFYRNYFSQNTNQYNQGFIRLPVIMYNHNQNRALDDLPERIDNHMIRKYQERIFQPVVRTEGIFKEIRTSQHSVEDVRRRNEELSKNFEVTRSVCANRLDFQNILTIQKTDQFKEAFGLLSDYWIFKVIQNNIFDNNKVRNILKSCGLIVKRLGLGLGLGLGRGTGIGDGGWGLG